VSQTSLTRLSYGDADLCLSLDITRLYGLGEFPDSLQSVPLRPVRWVCVMSKDQAIPGDSMTLADYQALPHVFARPNGHTAPVEELVRRMIGMDLNVRATTQSLLEMLFMLPGSPFAATVPERVAQLVLPLVPLKIFTLPFDALDGHEILLWHPRNELDPGHAWLRTLFIDVARDLQT
jgi:DNA-binding transcriptional LysR family regulator